MERILIVANDFPYPPNHGAAVDMWRLIGALNKVGYIVDMAVTVKVKPAHEHIEAVRAVVQELFIVERQRGWKAAVSPRPFQIQSRGGLRAISLSAEYSAAILVAEHVASILDNPSLHTKKRILRLHNDEVHFFQELRRSSKSVFEKTFYESEALKFRAFSRKVASKCDALWFISKLEMERHVARYPADLKKSFFVPPPVDAGSMQMQPLDGHKALFVGTLKFQNNASGVAWYVADVHESLSDIADYALVVAGNTGGVQNGRLEEIIRRHANIHLYENPKSLQDLYRDASVFVNPVFRGAGLKMKTVEAIMAGLPVVTTSTGIEGTGLVHGKHVLVADSPAYFASSIRELFKDRDLGRFLVASAQEFIAREFDQSRIVKDLLLGHSANENTGFVQRAKP